MATLNPARPVPHPRAANPGRGPAAALSFLLALNLGGCFDDGVKEPAPQITGKLVFTDGMAAPGAALSLLAHDSTVPARSGASQAKGIYALKGMTEGDYDLLATLKRGDTTYAALRKNIAYTTGSDLNLGADTLRPAGIVRVRVVGPEDAPIAGARCSIKGLPRDTLSDANGVCTLTELPPGQFEVIINKPGIEETVDTLKVTPGKTVTTPPVRVTPAPDTGSNPPTPNPSNSGLVAHWQFEDKTGNILRDATGKHDGLFIGNPVLHSAGVLGKSLQLDGSTHAVVPRSEEFGVLSSFTLSAWVLQYDQSSDEPLLEFSKPDTLGVHIWLNTEGNSTLTPGKVFANTITRPLSGPYMSGAALAPSGRWNHVAYTYDAASRAIKLYLNGSVVAQANLASGRTPVTIGDLYLGYRPLDSQVARKGARLRGRLDEVKVWSRALSTAELRETYLALAPELLLPASADALIWGPAPGKSGTALSGRNAGQVTRLEVGVWDLNTVVRSLLRFELPAVDSARIARAVLRVAAYDWIPMNRQPATIPIRAHRLLRPWIEGSGAGNDGALNSADVNGVTAYERSWGTQNGGEDWNTVFVGLNGVDASAAASAASALPSGKLGVWEIDVTALAKTWAKNPEANFGLILVGDIPSSNEESANYPQFHSREAAVADSLKPHLLLTLKAP